jgi:hypothetical protein
MHMTHGECFGPTRDREKRITGDETHHRGKRVARSMGPCPCHPSSHHKRIKDLAHQCDASFDLVGIDGFAADFDTGEPEFA